MITLTSMKKNSPFLSLRRLSWPFSWLYSVNNAFEVIVLLFSWSLTWLLDTFELLSCRTINEHCIIVCIGSLDTLTGIMETLMKNCDWIQEKIASTRRLFSHATIEILLLWCTSLWEATPWCPIKFDLAVLVFGFWRNKQRKM